MILICLLVYFSILSLVHLEGVVQPSLWTAAASSVGTMGDSVGSGSAVSHNMQHFALGKALVW